MSTTEFELVNVDAPTPHSLSIADVTPAGSADWPGRQAATILLQGCPWECTYCFTPDLQDPRVAGSVAWSDVIDHLQLRRGMLDAVVFSGGEPTRQPALGAAIREVKAMGYAVGLHTGGAFPGRLAAVLGDVDWVGIDIKATSAQYEQITGKSAAGSRAWTSLELVQHSGVDYEVRLTVDPTVHTRDDVYATVRELVRRGAKAPVLQQASAKGVTPEYAEALGGRGLFDVIAHDDLPDLERR